MLNMAKVAMCIILMLSIVFGILIGPENMIFSNEGGGTLMQLTIAKVTASSWTSSSTRPENTIDGILSGDSKWVAQNLGDWITFDLGAARKISSVDIAWVEGRQWYYDIEVSKDGESWTPVIQYQNDGTEGISAGTGGVFEQNLLGGEVARYIRIVNHGNSLTDPQKKTYIAIYEVAIMGEELGENSDNASLTGIRINGLDLQMFEPEKLRYDLVLNETGNVPVVEPLYENPNTIVNVIDAEQLPGVTFIDVISEDYSKRNRYKVNFILPEYTIKSVYAPRSDSGFGPELTLDLDYESKWKVEGKGSILQYELNTIQNINSVSIAWSSGNERTFYFELQTSLDGENWNQVYLGESSGTTIDLENYEFSSTNAKYVRIIGNGNNVTYYNAIFEVVIFAQSGDREIPIRTLYQGSAMLELSSDKTGYIFTHLEQPAFNLKVINIGDSVQELTFDYNVFSSNGRKVNEGSIALNLGMWSKHEQQLSLPLELKGVFTLQLKLISNSEIIQEKDIPFSRIISSAGGPGGDFFGINTHLHTGTRDIDTTLEAASMSGTGWIRDSGYWSRAETVKGTVQILPIWDEYINKAVEKGLKPLYILAYGNSLYGGSAPTTPESIAGYVNYATTVVNHFAGRINHFEVWNEFNGGLGNPMLHPPEVYAELLKASYPAIKAANPDAYVIGGVTAGAPLDWLESILQAGAFDYMDAVSIHPYMHPNSPEQGDFLETLENVRDLFMQYGSPKPIWISELGWPTHSGGRGITPEKSANYAVRAHVIGMASGIVENIFWYDIQNDGTSHTNPEHNFGLVAADKAQVPFAAKENYAAYSALTDKLAGAVFVRSYGPNDNTKMYHFHRASDNKDVIAAWTLSGSETFKFEVEPQSEIEMSDLYGNSLLSNYESITATLTETPVYFEGEFTNVNIVNANYELDKQQLSALADEVFDIKLISSAGFNCGTDQITIDFPYGWELVETGDACGTQLPMKVRTPSAADNKTHELYFYISSNGHTHTRLALSVYLSDRLFSSELNTKPVKRNGDEWEMEWQIKNYSSVKSFNAVFEMLEPAEWSSSIGNVEVNVGPNEIKTVTIPVPEEISSAERKAVYKVIADGESETTGKILDFLSAFNVTKEIVVDGSDTEEEWSGAVPFVLDTAEKALRLENWGGPSDLSGIGKLKWDNKNFYMIVEVEDNIHHQVNTDSGIWAGDSIQFAIDPGILEGGQNSGYSEIGMALSETGIEVWRWRAPSGFQAGEMNNTNTRVIRNGTKTTYEIAIPWSELLPEPLSVEPGDSVGFSLLINDNDGSGRRGWMEYGSGIGSSKDPSLFKKLHLLDNKAPVTKAEVHVTANNGWFTSDAQVTLQASDELSGVGITEFSMDAGVSWNIYSEPFPVTNEGVNLIQYRSIDTAGNIEEVKSLTLSIDKTVPVSRVEIEGISGDSDWYASDVSVHIFAEDEHSGIEMIQYAVIDSGDQPEQAYEFLTYVSPFILSEGVYDIIHRSKDTAGHIESKQTVRIMVDQTPPNVVVTVNGEPIYNGLAFVNTASIEVQAIVEDNLSGVAGKEILINGYPYTPGTPYDLAGNIGVNTVKVHVYDLAGNEKIIEFNFTVSTCLESIQELVDRYAASGELSSSLNKKLNSRLNDARHHLGKGDEDKAIYFMDQFLQDLNQSKASDISAEAKQVLSSTASALIQAWSEN